MTHAIVEVAIFDAFEAAMRLILDIVRVELLSELVEALSPGVMAERHSQDMPGYGDVESWVVGIRNEAGREWRRVLGGL